MQLYKFESYEKVMEAYKAGFDVLLKKYLNSVIESHPDLEYIKLSNDVFKYDKRLERLTIVPNNKNFYSLRLCRNTHNPNYKHVIIDPINNRGEPGIEIEVGTKISPFYNLVDSIKKRGVNGVSDVIKFYNLPPPKDPTTILD